MFQTNKKTSNNNSRKLKTKINNSRKPNFALAPVQSNLSDQFGTHKSGQM